MGLKYTETPCIVQKYEHLSIDINNLLSIF